jgi:hypothetical protein
MNFVRYDNLQAHWDQYVDGRTIVRGIFVWGYAFLLFVVTDFLKVHFYKVLDRSGKKFHA